MTPSPNSIHAVTRFIKFSPLIFSHFIFPVRFLTLHGDTERHINSRFLLFEMDLHCKTRKKKKEETDSQMLYIKLALRDLLRRVFQSSIWIRAFSAAFGLRCSTLFSIVVETSTKNMQRFGDIAANRTSHHCLFPAYRWNKRSRRFVLACWGFKMLRVGHNFCRWNLAG